MTKKTEPGPSAAAFAGARRAGLAYLRKAFPGHGRHHEDLVQNAFVKLLERGERCPSAERMIGLVRDVARAHVKRVETKRTVFLEDELCFGDDE